MTSAAPPAAPRRRWRWVLLALVMLLFAAAGSALFAWRWLDRWASIPHGTPGTAVALTIQPGTPTRTIAALLQRKGLVSDPRLLLLWLRLHPETPSLQAGRYRIPTPISPRDLVRRLGRGVFERSLTIPEGWTLRQVALRLNAEAWITDPALWLALTARPIPAGIVGDAQSSAEGFCFPETYRLDEGSSPSLILDRLLAEFRRQWLAARPDDRDPAALPLSQREIVTLASMVQREARVPDEMPAIARVYYNRLAARMRLQCDATVHYALGDVWDRPLTYDDLDVDSPYNTYRVLGLPPGPIANPGRAALEAALRPAPGDYLYYVYTGDGRHTFSRSFRDHQAAIRAARRPPAAASEPSSPVESQR